jgi:hypothetical protein
LTTRRVLVIVPPGAMTGLVERYTADEKPKSFSLLPKAPLLIQRSIVTQDIPPWFTIPPI